MNGPGSPATVFTYERRAAYARLLDGYLAGETPAMATVRGFFSMRTTDLDTADALGSGSWDVPRYGNVDWEDIYSDLFWACEDLDSPMEELSITEDGFRAKLGEIRSRMADFERADADVSAG